MKVSTKFGLKGFKGQADGMIYYTVPNCDAIIARKKPEKFTVSAHHKDYSSIAKNLKKIKPSLAFKNDFKVYTSLYKELPQAKKSIAGWYNLYIAMLWDMQKAGLCNLKTLTRQQIISNNLPCKSVKDAIDAGFLQEVLNYELLDNVI